MKRRSDISTVHAFGTVCNTEVSYRIISLYSRVLCSISFFCSPGSLVDFLTRIHLVQDNNAWIIIAREVICFEICKFRIIRENRYSIQRI